MTDQGRLPDAHVARQAVVVKRRLRLLGWHFQDTGLEPTGLYNTQTVTTPNGTVVGNLNSKTIINLYKGGFFGQPQWTQAP
ncbi:MAG: hypothetical protein Q8R28_18150 [Dehalococcoidia bacterium]|nr:hypothetical protein [Dehalococcoidia bacterium]